MSVKFEGPQLVELPGSKDGEVLQNGTELFGKDSQQNAPVKEGRIIRKAKRPSKHLQSPKKEEEEENGVAVTTNGARIPFTKNSRKSRNAKGRGLPKKGGAGGKGTWGAPGSEMLDEELEDSRDPNYDSDSQDNVIVKKIELPLTEDQLVQQVEPLLQEYLNHGDSTEVLESLSGLNIGKIKPAIPSLAVSLAMEKHNPQREMTSQLISDLYGEILSQEDVAQAFDNLLNSLSDLSLDTPDAPKVLGQFIARAVADDCLPPKFILSYKGKVEKPEIQCALDKADLLLSIKHGIVRLDNVWGVGGANRPVKSLIKRMILLLKEYLSSGDIPEATRCLKELDVPHFHHEVVYEGLLIAIEDTSERAADRMVDLFKSLYAANIITPDQMRQGVKRVYDAMPEICLDVPAAYSILEKLGGKLHSQKILSEGLLKDLPARGRKRFVSEGDGGLVKDAPSVY